jgi:hypothetical protein
VDKMRGRGSKNVCFCPRLGDKNCPRRGGGGKGVKKWQKSVLVVVECPLTMILVGSNQFTKDKIHPNGCYLVDTHSQKFFGEPECEILTSNLQMAPQYLPILGKVGYFK